MSSLNMSSRGWKAYGIFCKVLTALASIYLIAYSFIPENPEYGNHASTASNVGRDHRILFAFWGLSIGFAVFFNVIYALEKFNCNNKFPRICLFSGLLGVVGFILVENDKYQKLVVHVERQNFRKVTDEIQALVNSQEIREIVMTKKMFHTVFSIIFGIGFAFAILYLLVYNCRGNKSFKFATVVFIGYMLITASLLGFVLSGLVEAIAIIGFFGFISFINFSKYYFAGAERTPVKRRKAAIRKIGG